MHLINDILDFSKIEAGEMDIECKSFDIFNVIKDVENMLQEKATDKNLALNVTYQFPLPQYIHSDSLRVWQILLNLCNNAIKFTESGEVNIDLIFQQQEKQLVFAVRDTGIGLSEAQQEKIFQPFKQADTSTTRKYGGTGLGLSLSRRLAHLLGGELTVDSVLEQGAVFKLTLPLSDEDAQKNNLMMQGNNLKVQQSEEAVQNTRRKLNGHVLLVEDDLLNQELITAFLEEMGVNVSLANNGQEAVALTEQSEFDLVYMDMQMPVMSGLEAVKLIRQRNYPKPIV